MPFTTSLSRAGYALSQPVSFWIQPGYAGIAYSDGDETEQRLQTRAIELTWQQKEGLPDPALDRAQTMHLFRIGRESVTNALRHADAEHLRIVVGVSGNALVFEVTDDGQFDPTRIGDGRGTRSMRNRADELHGNIDWQQGTLGGTKVRLSFPLPPAAAGCPSPQPWRSMSR